MWKKSTMAVAGILLCSGCATDPRTGQPSFKETFASDDPCASNSRNTGVALGALAGALLANQLKKNTTARLLGAALGGTVGGLIGHDMDQRRCELHKVAQKYRLNLHLATITLDGVAIDEAQLKHRSDFAQIEKSAIGSIVEVRDPLASDGHFESGSDRLTLRAREYFAALAAVYDPREKARQITDSGERTQYLATTATRRLLLVGHTDDSGSSRLNADLSERRAKAVSEYLASLGLSRDLMYYQGAGEAYPVASNENDDGRSRNRRVEIVELADGVAFERFLTARKPRYELYRATPETIATTTPTRKLPEDALPKPAAPVLARKEIAGATRQTAKPAVAPASLAAPSSIGIDFGGHPYTQSTHTSDVGQLASQRSYFSLISTAHAADTLVLTDCTRDRPRYANSVKSLAGGRVHRTSEHLPGLFGKTWTDKVNAHQIVMNRVAVLAGDASVPNLPEFKVYANYAGAAGNPTPDLAISPEVNTYMGDKGLLYRMFFQGRGGLDCADVVFASEGGASARAGKLVYQRGGRQLAAQFKPYIYQK